MIQNILSIDCDVFTNCHTYAKHTNYDVSAEDAWNIIYYLEKIGYGINTNVDEKLLFKAVEILQKKCLNSEVVFIEEHDELVGVMEDRGCKDTSLYNIDAHIDINYGNDNSELNIENFVLHSKQRGLVDKYYWIHNTMSNLGTINLSPFKISKCNLLDVDMDMLPNFDLVVICTSHHFTPRKYWEVLPKYLSSYIKNIEYFKEVCPSELTYDMVKNLDDYLVDDTMPNISRLFRYKDCYVVFEEDTHNLSIVNLGEHFGINVCKEVVDYIVWCYGYGVFTYVEGIRNEILIKRLLKNYDITETFRDECNGKNIMNIKFKGVDKQ